MLRRTACGAALALTLTAPSALAADWSPPVDAGLGEVVSLALAPGGNLAIGYHERTLTGGQNDRPRIASRTDGAPFASAPTATSAGQVWTLSALADGSIRAHGLSAGRVWEARRAAGSVSGFGTPQAITPAESALTAFTIAFARNGAHTLGWRDTQRFLQTRFPDGGAEVPVDTQQHAAIGAPRAVVADDGQAAATVTSNQSFVHMVRSAGAGGEWGAPLAVNGTSPQLAMNARGDALLTWNEGALVKAAYRPAGGVFGASVELGTNTLAVAPPAIGPDGTGLVVFRRGGAGSDPLQAVEVRSTGVGRVQTIAPWQDGPANARVAIDARGDAFVVWGEPDGTASDLFARRAGRDLTFGDKEQLDGAGEDVARGTIRLATDGTGEAAVAWSANASPEPRVRVTELTSRYDPEPPPPDDDDDRDPPRDGGGPGPGPLPPAPPAPGPALPQPATPRSGPIVPAQALTRLAVKRSGRRATVTFTLRTAGRVSLVL